MAGEDLRRAVSSNMKGTDKQKQATSERILLTILIYCWEIVSIGSDFLLFDLFDCSVDGAKFADHYNLNWVS